MKFLCISLTFLVVVLSLFSEAKSEEFFKVLCKPLLNNEIHVKLSRASAENAIAVYEKSGQIAFKSHMKDLLKNIEQRDDTCLFGWVGEWDYNTAVTMYVAGYAEFSEKTKMMATHNHGHIFLNTKRSHDYDSNVNMFTMSD